MTTSADFNRALNTNKTVCTAQLLLHSQELILKNIHTYTQHADLLTREKVFREVQSTLYIAAPKEQFPSSALLLHNILNYYSSHFNPSSTSE